MNKHIWKITHFSKEFLETKRAKYSKRFILPSNVWIKPPKIDNSYLWTFEIQPRMMKVRTFEIQHRMIEANRPQMFKIQLRTIDDSVSIFFFFWKFCFMLHWDLFKDLWKTLGPISQHFHIPNPRERERVPLVGFFSKLEEALLLLTSCLNMHNHIYISIT